MKTEPFQPSLNSIFVYGTLKRGQLRESLWPCKPLMVQDAWTLGSLWDLGNYPGLESGHDPILGEIWILNHHDMEPTFKILDAIEGYDPVRDAGLYLRRTIDVIPLSSFSTEANPIRAFVYLFNRFEGFPKARKIRPWFTNSLADFPTPNPIPFENNSPLFAIWPDPDTIVPQSLQDED